ncbi:MAG: hypothetical protein D6725_17760 [Planctomycetota bacterium]|nr:MAG: hypothetical protein D6725_17760 [Planctomycetota bacterium]
MSRTEVGKFRHDSERVAAAHAGLCPCGVGSDAFLSSEVVGADDAGRQAMLRYAFFCFWSVRWV